MHASPSLSTHSSTTVQQRHLRRLRCAAEVDCRLHMSVCRVQWSVQVPPRPGLALATHNRNTATQQPHSSCLRHETAALYAGHATRRKPKTQTHVHCPIQRIQGLRSRAPPHMLVRPCGFPRLGPAWPYHLGRQASCVSGQLGWSRSGLHRHAAHGMECRTTGHRQCVLMRSRSPA